MSGQSANNDITLQKRICTTSRQNLAPLSNPFEHFLTTLIPIGFFLLMNLATEQEHMSVVTGSTGLLSVFFPVLKKSTDFRCHIRKAVVSTLRPDVYHFTVHSIHSKHIKYSGISLPSNCILILDFSVIQRHKLTCCHVY